MKRFFVTCLFFLMPINFVRSQNQLSANHTIQQPFSSSSESATSIMALKAIICILLGEALALSADQQSKDLLAEQMQLKNLLANAASNYGSHFITTLCHELGHAVASKILNGDPIDIHLGANSHDEGGSMISLGGISVDGFDPRKGYCNRELPHENHVEVRDTLNRLVQVGTGQTSPLPKVRSENVNNQPKDLQALINELRRSPAFQEFRKKVVKVNHTKQALVLLAGGIGGIVGRFLTKAIAHLVTNRTANNALTYKEALMQAASYACKPDHIYLNQLLNMLVPFNAGQEKSDATKLWEDCIGINPSVVRSLETIAPGIELGGEFYLAHNQAVNPNASAHTKSMIALLNYLNGGFVRFHV